MRYLLLLFALFTGETSATNDEFKSTEGPKMSIVEQLVTYVRSIFNPSIFDHMKNEKDPTMQEILTSATETLLSYVSHACTNDIERKQFEYLKRCLENATKAPFSPINININDNYICKRQALILLDINKFSDFAERLVLMLFFYIENNKRFPNLRWIYTEHNTTFTHSALANDSPMKELHDQLKRSYLPYKKV